MSLPLKSAVPSPPTFLVVEDSHTVLGAVVRILREEGFGVLTAGDGVEALELLERVTVHAILSDLMMPRMDGRRLALHVVARWPAIPMVFMTGHADSALTKDLPGPLLVKPFAMDDTIGAVRRALEPNHEIPSGPGSI
jgi:CheY-like chemotaxis protein